MDNPNRHRKPAALLAMLPLLALAAGGGIGFGGSGRPDFAPGPAMPERAPREPLPPEPPKRQHQPVFTAKQKASRAKRKAQRKARRR